MNKIRWGVLSTAKIARQNLIPAIQKSQFGEMTAIASRQAEKARNVADEFSIPRYYDSYDQLVSDPEIDAIYNPLPNDMHIPWTLKAIKAGKHVLCEKPIGLNSREVEQLLQHANKHPEIKVMEAFMYRFHPQWQLVKNWVNGGEIGKVKSVNTQYTYFKNDPENIRTDPEKGGGGLMDIGCYCISIARWIFECEPIWISGFTHNHSQWKVDTMTSGILDFGKGRHSTFFCGTLTFPYQQVEILGDNGRITVRIPVNAPNDQPCYLELQNPDRNEVIEVEIADQYIQQVDYFHRAIIDKSPVPTSLSDAINNMKVIEGIFKSAESGNSVHLT